MLAVDVTSPVWWAVDKYCEERIKQLTEECTSLVASPADRERAAYRIAELRDLRAAPARTRDVNRDRSEVVRGTY